MAKPKVLALIMAGGAGGRMEVLSQERAKPVLPYAGVYRLVDFPLSNLSNSGLSDVWVIEQYQPHSLNEHLANGRPWDLDRTYGGLRMLSPFQGNEESGWHQGNADAIYRNKRLIADYDPDLLLVLSSDHVYKLDYREVIERQLDQNADVTMVTTRVPQEGAGRFGVVETKNGQVTGFEYKPDEPRSDIVSTEVFVYNAPKLLATVDELVNEQVENGDGEAALSDFGDELLPRLVEEGRVWEFRMESYWKDVGQPESYWRSHMDLLGANPVLDLDDPSWPILSRGARRPPARLMQGSCVEDSLISQGCTILGRVERSVLSPGVVVEAGAVVRDSIILHDAVIENGATVQHSILDMGVRAGTKSRIGQEPETLEDVSGSDLTLVGARAVIAADTQVPGGERVEPGATVGAEGN